jgi:release factor glutamine methyltransferase
VSAPPTVRAAIRAAIATFGNAKSKSPRLDAELLMAEALGVRRDRLFAEPERRLTEQESAAFEEFVERRERREPIAYIVGHKAFRMIDLQVNENTLIPRPETETVVEVVIAELKRLDKETPLVLDIGTGCGAIGLALANEHPHVRVVATEVHPSPLEMARLNATRLGLADRVEFIVSDLFDDVPSEARFDVIVSNPPYVPVEAMRRLAPEIRGYEPHVALLGGTHGMDFYVRIIPAAPQFLLPGGMLAVEINDGRMLETLQLFLTAGRFDDIDVRNDLGGLPRVISGREKQ